MPKRNGPRGRGVDIAPLAARHRLLRPVSVRHHLSRLPRIDANGKNLGNGIEDVIRLPDGTLREFPIRPDGDRHAVVAEERIRDDTRVAVSEGKTPLTESFVRVSDLVPTCIQIPCLYGALTHVRRPLVRNHVRRL